MFFRDEDGNSYMEEVGLGGFKSDKEKEEYEKKEIKILMNRQEQIATFESPSYYIQVCGVKKWMREKYDKLLKDTFKVSFITNHQELKMNIKEFRTSKTFWYGKTPIYQLSVWIRGDFEGKKIGDLPEDLKIESVVESNGFIFASDVIAGVKSRDVHYSLGYGEIKLPKKINYFNTRNQHKSICLTKTDTLNSLNSYYL